MPCIPYKCGGLWPLNHTQTASNNRGQCLTQLVHCDTTSVVYDNLFLKLDADYKRYTTSKNIFTHLYRL